MKINLLSILLCTFYLSVNATIIRPFDNLGELIENSSEIIICKPKLDLFEANDQFQNYAWQVDIIHSFKGILDADQDLTLTSQSGRSNSTFHHILGDFKLELDKTYLIFLNENEFGTLYPIMLSYYIYEQRNLNGKSFWVPITAAVDMCTWKDTEPIFVLDEKLTNLYTEAFISSNYNGIWQDKHLKVPYNIYDFHPILRVPPAECTFLGGGNCGGESFEGIRWQPFPTDDVEIWVDTEQQTGLSSDAITDDATTNITTNYTGVNLSFQGIVGTNYNPTCGPGAQNGNFTTYSDGINGGDNILTIFEDPCDQITDLSGCSGTLAIGGLYGFCYSGGAANNDNHDGLLWLQGTNGFVIVNNGSECIGAADFELMMVHELTHALGLGHIDASNGTANMNPTCCNAISAVDVTCADYLYPLAGSAPVTWKSFNVKEEKSSNRLIWETSSETNNDYFELQHSFDGLNFQTFKIVEGSGNTTRDKRYEFNDNINIYSTSYYRVKQVDYDGQFSVSNIREIKRDNVDITTILFPNPAQDKLNIVGNLKGVNISIFDGLGKKQQVISLDRNDSYLKLNIDHLTKGIYYLEMDNNGQRQMKTFVKN